jgi:restriction system protein
MIPDYGKIMLPLLKQLSDDEIHTNQELIQHISKIFKLTEEEKQEFQPSGWQRVIDNRVGWAKFYLVKAGLVEAPKRGSMKITKLGHEALKKKPDIIDIDFLMNFEPFREFHTSMQLKGRVKKPKKEEAKVFEALTPEELMNSGFKQIKEKLYSDLLDRLLHVKPEIFERIVLDLLQAMGYGAFRSDAGKVTGKSGDEGIDGEIKEDKLGLDIIRIQAKRWKATIGRPEIMNFVGALDGKKAKKGIFLTTSTFTKDAIDYASNLEKRVILIDGSSLVKYIEEYNVGVSPNYKYEIKRIDTDYFSLDESSQ